MGGDNVEINLSEPHVLSGATASDLDKAENHLAGYNDRVIAVWKVSADSIEKVTDFWRYFPKGCLLLPCCWPLLILCLPCTIRTIFRAQAGQTGALRTQMEGTLYILGTKNLYRLVDLPAQELPSERRKKKSKKKRNETANLRFTRDQSGFQPLETITSATVDDAGTTCIPTFGMPPVPSVNVGLPPGAALAEPPRRMISAPGGMISMRQMRMYVDDPEEACNLIMAAKKKCVEEVALTTTMSVPPQMQEMVAAPDSPPTADTAEQNGETDIVRDETAAGHIGQAAGAVAGNDRNKKGEKGPRGSASGPAKGKKGKGKQARGGK
ncbi:unnamed protein product [Amoebophrya sp. A25]|nr:unnamed protein product [Amoebophrya sp. A25]|eukprot:GSA25T00026009001.1